MQTKSNGTIYRTLIFLSILLASSLSFAAVEQGPGQFAEPSASLSGESPVGLDVRPAYPIVQAGIFDLATEFPFASPLSPSLQFNLDFVSVNFPPEGDSPSELAFTADGSWIVIAHRDSQNLTVFDASTRTVVKSIALSGSPNSLALSSDNIHAVTANIFEDTASIVDLVAGTETAVVTVGDQPGIVRITPDGATAIVGNTLDSDLSEVDIGSATETKQLAGASFSQSISFGVWGAVYKFTDFEIALDNNTIIFPDLFNSQVVFFDIAAGTNIAVASQPNPSNVDMSPDGVTAVVSHHYPESRVSVIDVASKTIAKNIPTGGSATSVPPIAINPSKTKAMVAVQNAVRVVDLVSDTVSGNLSTGSVNGLLTTADGLYCVVGNYQGSIINFATETIVATTLNTTTPDGLAVSPAGPRAATIHALRKEHMEVMNTNGGLGTLEGVVPTGPPPEGDKARGVAVSPDGKTAVVINNHSQNAIIIDLETRKRVGEVSAGERPGGVAITPDGKTAVVANLDSSFATVIDLESARMRPFSNKPRPIGTKNVNISRRGGIVAISPDSRYAYIPVVADGDGAWRINLETLQAEGGKIITGNMGGIGYIFDLSSGMTLSHDGATLVTCGSFTNNVSIIDTASWTEAARVTVGTFPTYAAFSPDDSTIYVSNKNVDTVSVIDNNGASSTVTDTINVGDQPYHLVTNPAGTKLYVANFNARTISVVDLPGNVVSDTISIPQTDGAGQPVGLAMSESGRILYVAANGADFHAIDTSTNTIIQTINTGLAPAMMVFHEETQRALIPSPYGGDGLSIISVLGEKLFPHLPQ